MGNYYINDKIKILKATTLQQAYQWFLRNHSGSLLCDNGEKEKACSCYPEAEEFFNNKSSDSKPINDENQKLK